MKFADLPDPVRHGVARLAGQVHDLGGKLFLFGSFAAGSARPQSDLDLAFELPKEARASDRQSLFRLVEDLPTVRSIDLVDLAQATPEFREALCLVEIESSNAQYA